MTPTEQFSQLMQLDGQEMWIARILKFCKYTDISDGHSENRGRFFGQSLSRHLIDGERFVRSGGRPINYDRPNLDTTLRSGGLLVR